MCFFTGKLNKILAHDDELLFHINSVGFGITIEMLHAVDVWKWKIRKAVRK